MTKQDIQLLAGPGISFNPAFARIAGSVTAGLMLTQLNYWTGKEKSRDGWVFKTREQMEEETTLSRREQETAQRSLLHNELIEVQLKGVPAKLHYRVNYDRLSEMLSSMADSADLVRTPNDRGNPSLAESAELDRRKAPNKLGGNRRSITGITTETTQETTGQPDLFDSSLIERSVDTPNRAEQGAGGATAFELFWELYPRREHRKQAAQSWTKLSAADKGAAMIDIPKRLAANWAHREIRYLPHAATYLNQRMWEDELMRKTCTHGNCGARRCLYLNGNASGGFTSENNPDVAPGPYDAPGGGAGPTAAIPERDVMNPKRYSDETEEDWAYRMNDRWKILHPETGLPSPEYMEYVAKREAVRDEWYRRRGQL